MRDSGSMNFECLLHNWCHNLFCVRENLLWKSQTKTLDFPFFLAVQQVHLFSGQCISLDSSDCWTQSIDLQYKLLKEHLQFSRVDLLHVFPPFCNLERNSWLVTGISLQTKQTKQISFRDILDKRTQHYVRKYVCFWFQYIYIQRRRTTPTKRMSRRWQFRYLKFILKFRLKHLKGRSRELVISVSLFVESASVNACMYRNTQPYLGQTYTREDTAKGRGFSSSLRGQGKSGQQSTPINGSVQSHQP